MQRLRFHLFPVISTSVAISCVIRFQLVWRKSIWAQTCERGGNAPQRHLFGNWQESRFFIGAVGSERLGLKAVLADLAKNGDRMQYFEYVHDDGLASTY